MRKGKTLISAIILLLVGFLAGQPGAAQEAEKQQSVFGQKMQARYTPGNEGFKGQFFVAVSGGYHRWLDSGMGTGPMAAIAVGKWFTPLHGIRLEAGSGYFLDIKQNSRVKILPDVRISHLFNLTSFLDGYRPSQPGYFYTLAGLGYTWRFSPPSADAAGSWNAQLGLGYNLRVLRNLDLFVEPVFEINGNRYLPNANDFWRGYGTAFRGTVGVQYRLGKNEGLNRLWGRHPWFVTVSGGYAWQVAELPRNGFHIQAGFGEKLSHAVNLRLSGSWTHSYRKDADNHASYLAARLDGMVDLLALASGKEHLPVGISLFAGPEAGRLQIDEPSLWGRIGFLGGQVFYVGASAGVQLRTRIYRRVSAILEPRASFIPYVGAEADEPGGNRWDILLSGNLGLQYDFLSREDRRAAIRRVYGNLKRQYPRMHFFAGLEGIYFAPVSHLTTGGPYASLVLGGWFNPLHGLMLNGSLGFFNDLYFGNAHVKSSEWSAAYLFNLGRCLRDYDPARPLNLSLMAGAGYMMPIRELWEGSVLFRTGLDMGLPLLPRTQVVLRPEVNLFRAPSREWTPALRASLGLRYSIGGRDDARFPANGSAWLSAFGRQFVDQMDLVCGSDSWSTAGNYFVQLGAAVFRPFGKGYANGPLASVAFGRWLGPRHGVMLDVGAGYFRDNDNPPQHMAMGDVRASYLFRVRPLVSLLGGIGWLIPEIKDPAKGSLSAHGGLDVSLPLLQGMDLVVQPQVEVFQDPHNRVNGGPGKLAAAFRGTFGLRYNFYRKGLLPEWYTRKNWFIGLSGGYQTELGQYADAGGTRFSRNEYRVALSLGVQYSPAVSIRATGSFAKVFPQQDSFLHSIRYTSANLDFLYDLLATGDAGWKLSLSLLVGPEAGLFNKSVLKGGDEKPMRLPVRIGSRTRHSVGAYIGLSAGAQLKMKLGGGVAVFLEQRYSLIPYVQVFSAGDHRNNNSHLINTNLGIQYQWGRR